MSEYFPKPNSLGSNVKVEWDLSNYATKTDLKNVTGVDTSSFAKKTDLVHLKSDVDKLAIDNLKNLPTDLCNFKSKVDKLDANKLVSVPVDWSKLSDAVKNAVVTKDIYNSKIKNIEDAFPDITNLATNASLNAKKKVKGEISSINNLATNSSLNSKTNDVEGEIPNITNLATTTALTAIGNKTANVCNLVKIQTVAQNLVKLKLKLLLLLLILEKW